MAKISVVDTSIKKFSFFSKGFEGDNNVDEDEPDLKIEFSESTSSRLKKVRNSVFVLAKLSTKIVWTNFSANGVVVGTFIIPKQYKDQLIQPTDDDTVKKSPEVDEISETIANVLANKFRAYIGLLTGDALSYSIVPSVTREADEQK